MISVTAVPDRFVEVPAAAPAPAATPQVSGRLAASNPDELSHLWQRIWDQKRVEVGLLVAAIVVLTGVFFFQMQVTRHERFTYWFRIGFLTFTLFVLGWYANAQLSVVNILAFFSAAMTGLLVVSLPHGPADLHPVVFRRSFIAVLGARRVLWLVVSVWRPAGTHQSTCAALQNTADPGAVGCA